MPLTHWGPLEFLGHLDDVLSVYGEAMGYPPEITRTRRNFMSSHVHLADFRAVATLGESNQMLGFAYGYTSAEGQWWHDQVKSTLSPQEYKKWMSDCFELVELHVTPHYQGHGTGQRQVIELLAGLPHHTVVLSTPEVPQESTRAWRLYRRLGFKDMTRNFYFPGDQRAFAILGRALPLPATANPTGYPRTL